MKKVLLAGATGYLGSHIAEELQKKSYATRGIVRNTTTLNNKELQLNEVVEAELTRPDTIRDC